MSSHVFITGGVGFIGSKLAERWARAGAAVTVFDSFHPQVASIHEGNQRRLVELGVDILKGDVRDHASLKEAVHKAEPDIVYHLAAETGTGQSFDEPARYCDVNVTGTANLIEALRTAGHKAERVIIAGSRAVYGEGACVDETGQPVAAVARTSDDLALGDFSPKDRGGNRLTPAATNADCPANPASIYASTKLMQEQLLEQGLWGSGIELGILRLQNVYGPGQAMDNPYTGVLSIFLQQVAQGKTLEIYEDGEITRDFVFIDDVVTAFYQMGTIEAMPKGIIDIGNGVGTTILDAARQILTVMHEDPQRLKITGRYRPGDVRHAVADIARAADELGWHPQHSFALGIDLLAAWGANAGAPSDESGSKEVLAAIRNAPELDIET